MQKGSDALDCLISIIEFFVGDACRSKEYVVAIFSTQLGC